MPRGHFVTAEPETFTSRSPRARLRPDTARDLKRHDRERIFR